MKVIWFVNSDRSIGFHQQDGTQGILNIAFGSCEDDVRIENVAKDWTCVRILLSSRWCYWVDKPEEDSTNGKAELSFSLEEDLPLDAENIQCGSNDYFSKNKILATEVDPLKELIRVAEENDLDIPFIGSESIELALEFKRNGIQKEEGLYLGHTEFEEMFLFEEDKISDWVFKPKEVCDDRKKSEITVKRISSLHLDTPGFPSAEIGETIPKQEADRVREILLERVFKEQMLCNLAVGKLESTKTKTRWQKVVDGFLLSLMVSFLILAGSFYWAGQKEKELAEFESSNADIRIREIHKPYPRSRKVDWLNKRIKKERSLLKFSETAVNQKSCLSTARAFGLAYLKQFPIASSENQLKKLELRANSFHATGNFPEINFFWKEMAKHGFESNGRQLTETVEKSVSGSRVGE